MTKESLTVLACCLTIASLGSTVNIADFGASGDAVRFTGSTTSGSGVVTVTSTNVFSSADVGKLVELFYAGTATSGTNHQDYIGTVASVSGSDLTLSPVLGATLTGVPGILGTNNATAIQAAVNSLSGTNDVVTIPSGTYLCISPYQVTNSAPPGGTYSAISIGRGGITFQGESGSTLLNCGAWRLSLGAAHRGVLFALQGAVTNNYPLVFDTLIFDGGVAAGFQANHTFPASSTTGDGWDLTHDAFFDIGPAPIHASKTWRNCTFQHWRGEMAKSGIATDTGTYYVTNCVFRDGNASALNFGLAHQVNNSTFDKLVIVEEFYSGYSQEPSLFSGNIVTNVESGIVINGALTNHVEQLYTISGNSIYATNYVMTMTPARNLFVTNNIFGLAGIVATSSGSQGDDLNADWVICDNIFTNFNRTAVYVSGAGAGSATSNIWFLRNRSYGAAIFAYGNGYNVSTRFTSNTVSDAASIYALDSRTMNGIWFYDDGSNQYVYHDNHDFTGITNTVSYNAGALQIVRTTVTNAVFLIDCTYSKVPYGSQLVLTNAGSADTRYVLENTGAVIQSAAHTQLHLYWGGGQWRLYPASVAAAIRTGGLRSP